MLSTQDNELLTRVEGDAPMGRVIRRYWIPAYRSDDLIAGGAPARITLLGQRLVAFRGHDGVVGVLDELCPHRLASLGLARNVDCSLQCIYHGWRIAADGTVVDTPSEPDDSTFKDKVRQPAYPVREAGGLIWTYLGADGTAPRFPEFEFTTKRPDQVYTLRVVERCNWVQALEGVLDSAHIGYLHNNLARKLASGDENAYTGGGGLLGKIALDGHPKLKIENTPYGYHYAAVRAAHTAEETVDYVRTSHFIAPFFGMFAAPATWGFQQAFVPIDDVTTMFYFMHYRLGDEDLPESEREHIRNYSGVHDLDEEFRLPYSVENWWRQDRAAMERDESFSGLAGVQIEDFAAQESMGPIIDHSREHLGTSDIAVIRMRRLMLDAARTLQTDPSAPLLAQGDDFDYAAIRAEEELTTPGAPWQMVGRSGRSQSPEAATVGAHAGEAGV